MCVSAGVCFAFQVPQREPRPTRQHFQRRSVTKSHTWVDYFQEANHSIPHSTPTPTNPGTESWYMPSISKGDTGGDMNHAMTSRQPEQIPSTSCSVS